MECTERQIAALDLVCSPRTEVLNLIRNVVTTVSREAGFGPDDTSQIEISVDEACTNVIRHAYTGYPKGADDPGQVALRVQICPMADRMAITVIDQGRRTSCEAFRGIASLEEYIAQPQAHHGLGSYIISRFMDKVEYHSSPETGTVLVMVKYRRSTEETAP